MKFQRKLIALSTTAYYVNPNLFAMIDLKGANETLKHGLIDHSGVTFIVLATLYEAILNDYEAGFQIGEMALRLNKKLGNRRLEGRIYHTFALFIQHWKRHIRNDIETYRGVYQLFLNAGNLIFAGHSVNATLSSRLTAGDRLDDIFEEARKYEEFIRHVKDPLIESQYRQNILEIKNLKDLTPGRLNISGDEFDEEAELEKLKNEKNLFGLCFLLLFKLQRHYRYGAYEEADRIGAELDACIYAPIGTMMVAQHCFYYCLTRIALFKSGDPSQKRKTKRIVRKYLRRMAKWARLCPENFRHKHDLVKAEFLAATEKYRLQETYEGTLSGESGTHQIDLTTVMEVSQAISGEIMLDSLLKKIMHLSVVNAGAQRGFLLLNTEGRLNGILYMENNMAAEAFTKDRLELLGAIASQAAISLENARLFEQATTDGLTRLYVPRYFHFLLGQEIERSQRYGRRFSLVMIDIDNFIEQAIAAAGKLRARVEEMEIFHREERLKITISLGIATFPDHAAGKSDLISAADNALYASKHAGKNRVTVAASA